MPNSVMQKVAEWQGGRHVLNHAAIQGPVRRTLVWETDSDNGVAIIEKVGDNKKGHFVSLRIDKKNRFKTVVANVKRAITLERKKLGEPLC